MEVLQRAAIIASSSLALEYNNKDSSSKSHPELLSSSSSSFTNKLSPPTRVSSTESTVPLRLLPNHETTSGTSTNDNSGGSFPATKLYQRLRNRQNVINHRKKKRYRHCMQHQLHQLLRDIDVERHNQRALQKQIDAALALRQELLQFMLLQKRCQGNDGIQPRRQHYHDHHHHQQQQLRYDEQQQFDRLHSRIQTTSLLIVVVRL